MYKNDKYHFFIIKFLHLAGEVWIMKSEYQNEFFKKLVFNFQRIITDANAICTSFTEFQKHCTNSAWTLEFQNTILSCQKKNNSSNNSTTLKNSRNENKISLTNAPATGRRLSKNKKAILMKESKYFYCKESEHMILNCLRKNWNANVKELKKEQANKKSGKESV